MNETRELQLALLKFWKELKVILDNNKIRYFAAGGTAIGAIREGGFIPWDDDLDINVFAEDRAKFEKAINESKFLFVAKRSKDDQFMRFAKVYHNEIEYTRYESKPRKLYIDIFYVYKEKKWNWFSWRYLSFLRFLGEVKRRYFMETKNEENLGVAIGFSILKMLLLLVPSFVLRNAAVNFIENRPVVESASEDKLFSYENFKHDSYNVTCLELVKFEDSEIVINKAFAEDTKWMFGDIMIRRKDPERIHGLKLCKQ